MKVGNRSSTNIAAAAASLLLAALAQPLLAAVVPNPVVTGPIPATAKPGDASHDYPFFSTTVDLAAHGYVEEEYFFEGAANRYNMPTLAIGSIMDRGNSYKTRILVRRPKAAGNFNGIVLLEWMNVTASYDLDAFWIACHDHMIRRGFAWIGVSAQRAGIHTAVTGLKAWSPNRYGTLDVTKGGAITDDALSYDIFSQAAQAVRSPMGIDPMGGLPVKRVLALGYSQSANRVTLYHNSIQPLAEVFDAFFIGGGGGLLRWDVDVKVFKVLSETDIGGTSNQALVRQPDTDHFRRWEVAGASHLDYQVVSELNPLQVRDGVTGTPPVCDSPPLSRIPYSFVFNAALDHMVRWLERNVEPPSSPELALVTDGPPVVYWRDNFGIVPGGIRLPQLAVPTATNTGVNGGTGFCRLYGTYLPFDRATLDALYPTFKVYVTKVMEATMKSLAEGYLVPEDAITTLRDAVNSDIGRF
jgi:hypothetical protein